jgi:DNA-binding transcriptional MerR regulator
LSPKALRIYDDQHLLVPARVDAITGYRFYRTEQVPAGRLIRTLREMGLSLAEISNVVANEKAGSELILADLAQELEHRHAREKRAYYAALTLLRGARRGEEPQIEERQRAETTAVVQPFTANRHQFVEMLHARAQAARELGLQAGLVAPGEIFCALLDPLSDDEGRLEIVMPVETPARIPHGLTLRQLPAAPCAVISRRARHTHASDVDGALDALFDWFDRRSCRAIETPMLAIVADSSGLRTEVSWAFERITG